MAARARAAASAVDRPGREIALLIDYRADLVDESRRLQTRVRWLLHDLDPELAPADRGLRNEGVLRPLAMKLARREQTAPVQCAAAAIGIVGRDSCTVARGDGSGVVNPWVMR